MGWYILAGLTGLFAGVVFGWSMCAICTVAKCDDCVVNNWEVLEDDS